MNRIRYWPLRRDDHSGVLIGAGWRRRSDWPARVLANDVSTRVNRLHACRDKWQQVAIGFYLTPTAIELTLDPRAAFKLSCVCLRISAVLLESTLIFYGNDV